MLLNALTAISPIDGRYRSKVEELSAYFSEFGLTRYRVLVEVEYFIALCKLPLPQLKALEQYPFADLQAIYLNFSEADAQQIKETEKVTNHDVKAVEYFLKDKFEALGLAAYSEFIHFGLTSQDINNTAIPLSLKEAIDEVYAPALDAVINKLAAMATDWASVPMLARTHGQPASPTRLGKELMVFVERLTIQKKALLGIPYAAKFGGATGNLNAHVVAYPAIDWVCYYMRI
jgi:adenylosuccinate lyase